MPFAANLDAASIMTSHVVLEAFDAEQPATLSRAVLTDLLRDELGYDGVIVSDALDMAGASAIHGIGGAAVLSLAAGADLLCLGPEPTDQPSLIDEAVDAVCAAVEDGRLERRAPRGCRGACRGPSYEMERRAVPRQLTRSSRWPRPRRSRSPPRRSPRRRRDSAGPATVIRIDTGTNPAVGDTSWGQLDLGGDDDQPDARGAGGCADVRRRSRHRRPPCGAVPEVWDWVQRQLADNPQAVLVELGWPGPELDGHDRVIRTYGSAAVLTDALSAALKATAMKTRLGLDIGGTTVHGIAVDADSHQVIGDADHPPDPPRRRRRRRKRRRHGRCASGCTACRP